MPFIYLFCFVLFVITKDLRLHRSLLLPSRYAYSYHDSWANCEPGVTQALTARSSQSQVNETAHFLVSLIIVSSSCLHLQLQVQVTNLLAANRTGGQIRTDFSAFPTPAFAKVSFAGK